MGELPLASSGAVGKNRRWEKCCWPRAVLTTVLQGQERVVSRQWFRSRHVQSGSRDLAAGQGPVEVVLVYHFSPGDDGGCPEALLIARKGLEWLRGEGCPCNTLSGLEASCAHFEDPRQPGVWVCLSRSV